MAKTVFRPGEAKIVELNCDIDLNSDEELSKLNKKLNKEIKRYIKKGLNVSEEKIKNMNLIIETGACKKWHNNYVSSDKLYRISAQ